MLNHSSQQPVKPVVIGIAGRVGAGKTSVGKHLSSVHGFFYIRYSQVLADWLTEDPEGKAQLQLMGWEVMAGGMQAELNSRLLARIPAEVNVAVDGLRHPLDYETLSEKFAPRFRLLYIESSLETRWHRLQHRFHGLEDFSRAESHPVEQLIPTLRGKAFAILENEGSLQDLYTRVDTVLNGIHHGESV